MKLTVVEGNNQRLDGGAMFGNAPKALWQRWIEPDDLNRIPMACRCLLLQKDGKNYLFETGVGAFFDPAMADRYGVASSEHELLNNLSVIGLTDADIDYVILSHLHFDHAGGLLSQYKEGKEAKLLFPNARFLVGKAHFSHAMSPHFRDRASFVPALNRQLVESGRLILIDRDNLDLLPGIRFFFSDGHTPGLLISEISTDNGPVVFTSDLIPGQFWVHLPICMGYDRFPEKLIDEKQVLLNRLVDVQGRVFFTHDHQMACGRVMKDQKGKFSVVECAEFQVES